MTIRRIVIHPQDDILRKISEPVDISIPPNKELIGDLFDTWEASRGAGLSAIQIGVPQRLGVAWSPQDWWIFANPVILESSGELFRSNLDEASSEGCLSVPMEMFKVPRANKVTVEYYAPVGEVWEKRTVTLEKIYAQIIQHEIDHMNGKLIVDYMDERNQNRIRGRLRKLKEKGFVFPPGAK